LAVLTILGLGHFFVFREGQTFYKG